jgi:uncharacterized repeat protein (TIGR02543 family)
MKMSAQILRLGIVALTLSSSIRLDAGAPPVRTFNPGNTSSPYGVINLDAFAASTDYEYCKWGVLMSEGSDVGDPLRSYFSKTVLTQNADLFLLNNRQSNSLVPYSEFSSRNVEWLLNGLSIPYSQLPDPNTVLMRQYHFPSSLQDVRGMGALIGPSTKKVVVLIHGWNSGSSSNSYDNPVDDKDFYLLSEALKRALAGTEWTLVQYHWEKDADTGPIFSPNGILGVNGSEAAEAGRWHGYHLGELLDRLTDQQLEKAHFIVHSAGTWVGRGAIKYLLSARANSPTAPRIKTQLTLLDPFIPSELGLQDGPKESQLTPALINQLTTTLGASSDSLFRLENYFAQDPFPLGSGASTQVLFSWRGDTWDEAGFQVGNVGGYSGVGLAPGSGSLGDPYGSHAGPILFYADTVAVSSFGVSSDPSSWLRLSFAQTAGPEKMDSASSLNTWGWRRSMFYNEPVVFVHPAAPTTAVAVGASVPFSARAVLRGNRQSNPWTSPIEYLWERRLAGGQWETLRNWEIDLTGTGSSYNQTNVQGWMNNMEVRAQIRTRAGYEVTNATTLRVNTGGGTTPTPTPPAAPTNLAATATSSSSINLAWLDNSNNETGFRIERKIGTGGTWAALGTNKPANSTTHTDTGLNVANTYFYRVAALNGTLLSAFAASSGVSPLTGPPPQRQLTVTSENSNGAVSYSYSPPPISGPTNSVFQYAEGTTVTLTAPATASNGNVFLRWNRNGNSFATTQAATFVLTGNEVWTMVYSAPPTTSTYTVNVSTPSSASGSVTGGGSFGSGAWVTVRATAASGYSFWNWTSGGQFFSVSAETSFQVTSNMNLVANFVSTGGSHNIVVTGNPAAGGNITGAGSYANGQTATLVATPVDGWFFQSWTEYGSILSYSNTLSFPVYQSKEIVANYSPDPSKNYTLWINSVNGTAFRTPNQTAYSPGSNVSINATPLPGYYFTGWSEDASGTTNPISVVMDRNKSVTANFAPVPASTYTLSVEPSVQDGSSGTITKSPNQAFYSDGSLVSLTANAGSGSAFVGWKWDAYGTSNPSSITMNSNKIIYAQFVRRSQSSAVVELKSPLFTFNFPYTQTNGRGVIGNPTRSGAMLYFAATTTVPWIRLTSSMGSIPGLSGTSESSVQFIAEENTTLSPRTGEIYVHAPGATNSPQIFTVNQAAGVVRYALSTSALNGAISRSPDQPTYATGTQVTLTANPSAGFAFSSWGGDASGSQNPLTVSMNSAKSITATFYELPKPDIVTQVSLSTASGPAGSRTSIQGTVRNQGVDNANSGRVYFRVTDAASSAPAITVGQAPFADFAGLAASAFQNLNYEIVLPNNLQPGSYRVWVIADPENQCGEQPTARTNNKSALSFTVLPDTGLPTITIATPSTPNSVTTIPAIGLDGVASDNVSVAQITWQNDRGGSGVASGTSTWTVNSVPLQLGDNVINVTAIDGAGNITTAMVTVTYYPPDMVSPAVAIGFPSTDSIFNVLGNKISLGGTASDDSAISQVTWTNNRGGNGTATGKTNWVVPSITLAPGLNVLSVAAQDYSGNTATDTLTIEATIIPTAKDPNLPSVKIVNPIANGRTETLPVVVSGSALAKRGVQSVLWKMGDSPWQTAAGTNVWSFSLNDLPGGNATVLIKCRDAEGYESNVVTRSFTRVVRSDLTLTVVGQGTVKNGGFTSPVGLEIGKNYKLTATPAKGWVFEGWSGGLVSALSTITFTMQDGLDVTATFVQNPFATVAGAYLGLARAETDSHATSGLLRSTVTTTGAFSGTLLLGGKSYKLKGKFDSNGQWVGQIARSKQLPLSALLMLDVTGGSDTLTGLVSDGSFTAAINTDRATFNAKTNAAPSVGKYSFAIEPEIGDTTAPVGYGAGTLVVDAAGKATLTGKLADATAITFTSQVSKNGRWPLHVLLYTSTGSITGEMLFADLPDSDSSGGLYWFKPARPKDAFFKNGFDTQPNLLAQRFTTPAKNVRILTGWDTSSGAGTLTVSSADLPSELSQPVTWTIANLIQSNGSILPSLKVTPVVNTGLFSGSFLHPTTRKSMPFSGAFLQKTQESLGWLQGATSTGSVMLEKAP